MNAKTTLGIVIGIIGLFLLVFMITQEITTENQYTNEILYHWNLADKSSTIEAKAEHIDAFIKVIEISKFAEYNAIFLKNPDNNVQNNINALKTLKKRLDEIKTLDPNTFAYQTAIQQITAQEQGEADKVLSEVKGGWYLKNYSYLWDWIRELYFIVASLMIISGVTLFGYGMSDGGY